MEYPIMSSIKNPINWVYIFIFILTSTLLPLFSCKESTEGENKEIELPNTNITYYKHLQELFVVKCASAPGCHSQIDQASGLNLVDYNDIMTHTVENELIVQPQHGEISILYRILIEDTRGRLRMPLNGPYLNSNNTNGVKIWIDEGANP